MKKSDPLYIEKIEIKNDELRLQIKKLKLKVKELKNSPTSDKKLNAEFDKLSDAIEPDKLVEVFTLLNDTETKVKNNGKTLVSALTQLNDQIERKTSEKKDPTK